MMHAEKAFQLISKEGQYFKNRDGNTLYYYNNGNRGKPPVLFLHTLRTQAEFHHKILPYMLDDYDCFLIDWPGHGRSSKDPSQAYSAQYMVQQVIEFIESNDLKELMIIGESIGATGALSIAAKLPSRVRAVYASNPYDAGLVIGGIAGKIVSWLGAKTPLINKDEVRAITKYLIGGGFYDRSKLDDSFIDLISDNAKQEPKFGAVLYSFFANQNSWHTLREKDYAKIADHIKVTLLYSVQDWAPHWVREQNEKSLGGTLKVVKQDMLGHFSFLEHPEHIIHVIRQGELA